MMTWREWLGTLTGMPDTEELARKAYFEQLKRIDVEVREEDRDRAREILGDMWGEAARFRGWDLCPID